MERGRWLGALCTALGLAACTTPEPARKAAEQAPAARADAGTAGAPGPGESVGSEDTNGDGRPDVRITTRKVEGPAGADVERLLRRELDINYDGTFDVTKDYDISRPAEEGEVLAREAVDANLDGRPDTTSHYEKGLVVRQERDVDGDGRPDVWLHYLAGRQTLSERDTNGDGRADYWEYWKEGRVERIAEDLDGDGKPDKSTGNPNAPANP
ncbi:MAG TPA: VCBS repeat-containing protein [Aggregicoccus sp.]|nr:VCBS repeat-containing protein [Aggregicoccus sp.]